MNDLQTADIVDPYDGASTGGFVGTDGEEVLGLQVDRSISSSAIAALVSHQLKSLERNRSWLARRLGVHVMWISRRLNGTQSFKVDELEPIARAFGMTATQLLDLHGVGVSGLEITTQPDESLTD